MDREQFLDSAYDGSYIASFNQRYHTKMARFWAIADRSIRVVVGVLATISFGLTLASNSAVGVAVSVAFLSALAAILVNVVPFGEWEKTHRDLFRRWTDLRQRWESADIKARALESGPVPAYLLDLAEELNTALHRIEAEEPAPKERLLHKCQAEENVSRYDEENPSEKEILKRRKKKELAASGT